MQQRPHVIGQRRQLIMNVVGACQRDVEDTGEIIGHRIGPDGLALDDPGIAIAGLAARLLAVDQGDRPATALQMQRRADADHATSENDRASHRHHSCCQLRAAATTVISIFTSAIICACTVVRTGSGSLKCLR